jgi:CRP-like cAMP-binding protein
VAATRVLRSETFPDLADEVIYPRLSEAKLAWFREHACARRSFAPGEVLYEHAVREAPFFVIEQGLVEFVDRKPGKDVHVAQADGGTFIGDIAIFTGEPTISACVAVEPTDVLAFDRAALRDMVARWPEFGEHIFRTLLARRAWHEQEGHGVMRLIAPRGSRRAFEVRDLLERNLLRPRRRPPGIARGDDVALPRRPHPALAADRGDDGDRADRGRRLGDRRVGHAARSPRRRRAGRPLQRRLRRARGLMRTAVGPYRDLTMLPRWRRRERWRGPRPTTRLVAGCEGIPPCFPQALPWVDGVSRFVAVRFLRGLEQDVRHASRAYAGAGEARREAGAA